ncbi:mannose-6-phosphate isomerase, class I [Nocardioides marmoriginsengisoli]|uniref:mannose-6-phosphate isomerase n=1 Tax=Nocardioides marmoriginsengisoli TaxID=661483 RepID=A0A3N0CRM5_9ACTN|nr:mannose-6-phosphate isomerase, class I [Nocardioides marmoriginsengisoli]RNL66095.1 mannose-6-phosphate isomerase, class I [Nocardioides marmoriginsengisoli]
MHRLRNGVKHYDWGSRDAIPQFLGDQAGDEQPIAEVWIGTHPLSPSVVVEDDGAERPLAEVAGDLPFMVKLLAADRPLSLQVHPARSLAERGFAREEEGGVPLDAPHRVYKDPNHKPEMVYALTTFDSLIGFRPSAEILRVLGPLDTPLTQSLSEELRADPGFGTIVQLIERLLADGVDKSEVHRIVEACRTLSGLSMDIKRAYQTAVEIAEYFPDDIGVVISLMLNRMTLQPGEAAYLETGVIHAHLKGLCLEVMASSDNVLRAGLTTKHIDTAGLVECLESGMARVSRVTPDFLDYDTEVFSPAGGGFALAVTQISAAAPEGVELVRSDGSVLICTGGEVVVTTENGEKITLARGESLYLAPDDRSATVHGLGEVAQAYVPPNRALRSRLVDVV